jgi:hypothetical protein
MAGPEGFEPSTSGSAGFREIVDISQRPDPD